VACGRVGSNKYFDEVNASYRALDTSLETCGERRGNVLDRLALHWPADEALLLHLTAFAEQADPLPQMAATGLLKRYMSAGASFPDPVVCRILDLLPAAARWESRLHLLQMLPQVGIPADRTPALHAFLQHCLASEHNRFLRAWTYAGLHRLAALHARYRAEVAALLERAAPTEPASVRARLRRLPALADWRPGGGIKSERRRPAVRSAG
jgi:hypothetical protein